MAQTTSTKEKQPPIEKYNRHSCIKRRTVWLYCRGIETSGQEGLSPKGFVGGVTDYSICRNVKYYLTQKKFTHQAKVSKTTRKGRSACIVHFIEFDRF
jgi:hypothetical protein